MMDVHGFVGGDNWYVYVQVKQRYISGVVALYSAITSTIATWNNQDIFTKDN